jgi:hypothetical protein
MTTTTPAPVYLLSHRGHDRTDPRYTTVGYDVIRASRDGDQLTIEVTAVVHGAGNYSDALTQAKAHRDPTPGGAWGYPADRYACGCRWIATSLRANGTLTAPAFIDLPA